MAANAGEHVLVEKLLSLTMTEGVPRRPFSALLACRLVQIGLNQEPDHRDKNDPQNEDGDTRVFVVYELGILGGVMPLGE